METIRIDVSVSVEGVYRIRPLMEYSIGGEKKTKDVNDDDQEIGFFDRERHRIFDLSANQWEDG